MTQDRHPLAGIQNQFKAFADMKDQAFEEEIVKRLLTEYEIPKLKYELLRRNEADIGRKVLTLLGFCRYFSNFPVTLQSLADKFSMSDKLHYLLQNFEERAPVQKFLDMRNELPDELRGRPFALVLKWPYMPKGLVVHTLGDTDMPGSRITFRRKGLQIGAEPFPQFLAWLRTRWSPQS
jgi:hypothetical protein